jgi:hypothetical protein
LMMAAVESERATHQALAVDGGIDAGDVLQLILAERCSAIGEEVIGGS